jgi:hypothetical protein
LLLVAAVAAGLVWSISNSIRISRLKKLHGCKPEVSIRQSERIIGYQLYKMQIQASKDRNILRISRQRYLDYGNTWSGFMMGKVGDISPCSSSSAQLTGQEIYQYNRTRKC